MSKEASLVRSQKSRFSFNHVKVEWSEQADRPTAYDDNFYIPRSLIRLFPKGFFPFFLLLEDVLNLRSTSETSGSLFIAPEKKEKAMKSPRKVCLIRLRYIPRLSNIDAFSFFHLASFHFLTDRPTDRQREKQAQTKCTKVPSSSIPRLLT